LRAIVDGFDQMLSFFIHVNDCGYFIILDALFALGALTLLVDG